MKKSDHSLHCSFCRFVSGIDPVKGGVFFRNERFIVIHNQDPFNNITGWLQIVPVWHANAFDNLITTAGEVGRLQFTLTARLKALTRCPDVASIGLHHPEGHYVINLIPVTRQGLGLQTQFFQHIKPIEYLFSILEMEGFCDHFRQGLSDLLPDN